jgi:putative heme-binding domain-containing protein
VPEHYLRRNPHLAVGSMTKMLARYPNANRLFAVSRAQQRFNWPNALFEVTSACSATPYRDELFGPEFENSIFICEPANNIIHREVLQEDGVSFVSHRAASETNSEFLASTDNWSRPVMVRTGPDGALYFADMYRLIIEHPEYFPEELKHRPDMRAGEDKGRIYRIYPAGAKLRKVPRLAHLGTEELVQALESPNGWQRDTVQRLVVQSHNIAASKALEQLMAHSRSAKVRLQVLCTLDGLHALSIPTLLTTLDDSSYAVRRQGVALSESLYGRSAELDRHLLALADDPDLRVRYQLAFSLGEWHDSNAGRVLARLALKDWSNEAMQTAVLSSAVPHIKTLLNETFANGSSSLPPSLVEHLFGLTTDMSDDSALANALEQLAKPATAQYTAWQTAGVAGFLDALDRRHISLPEFRARADSTLQKRVANLEPLFSQARQVAIDSNANETERLLACRLLGRGLKDQEQDINRLGELLHPQSSSVLQQAALSGLRRSTGAKVAEVLLHNWRAAGLNQRQEILNILFSRQEWTEAVLGALEQGTISPGELGTLQQQKLLNHSAVEIRERSARLFSRTDSDRKKIVEQYKNVAEMKGERARGHSLFTQNCSICHRLKNEGQSIGPDLGTVANKPVSELIVAILDPNQAVDPAYTAYTAVTKDDREVSGILVAETPNSISLRIAGGAEELIPRNDLKELTSSGRSLMPEGFEAGLKPQDLADVIAYVLDPWP